MLPWLFFKMCYCTSNRGALSDGIAAGEEKTEALTTDITKAEEEKAATQEALEQAHNGRVVPSGFQCI